MTSEQQTGTTFDLLDGANRPPQGPRRPVKGAGRARAAVTLLWLAMALLAPKPAGAADPGFTPNTLELLPYGASGYRFLEIASDSQPPQGFSMPSFNDSGWNGGRAAFGSVGKNCPLTERPYFYCTPPSSELQRTVNTFWRKETKLDARKEINVPEGASDIRILVAVDNDITAVYFNGTVLPGQFSHEGAPERDSYRFAVPSGLVHPGRNLVAFVARDRGGSSFFDASVLAELPAGPDTTPVCTAKQAQSWKPV